MSPAQAKARSALWLLLLLVLASGVEAAGTAGVYVDRAGARHPWRVDANGMMHWDGRPFLPVGGMFCFSHLSEYDPNDPARNESRLRQDIEILETIRRAGIRHLYVNPVNPATRYPPHVWNRCLLELERLGFEYGIELTDGPRDGMDGWLVGGSAWAARATSSTVELRFEPEFGELPLLKELLAVSADGSVHPVSLEPSRKATWILPLPCPAVALVPRIVAPKGYNVPDLAGGYAEYEKRLLAWLQGLSRLPGLRFIVDPFTNELNLYRYTAHMAPPAGPVPLPGTKWLLDPVKRTCRAVDPARSPILTELREKRDASIASYCGRLARALRRGFADLPIVYKHVGRLTRFLTRPEAGADGIGIQSWGRNGADLVRTAGPAVAVVAHWNRPGWVPVTETGPSPDASSGPIGFPSKEALFTHLDILLAAGARGFYVFALRPLPEDMLPNFCLYRDPKQLDWLAAYDRALAEEPRAGRLRRRIALRFEPAGPGFGLGVRGWKTGDAPPPPISRFEGGALVVPKVSRGAAARARSP